ncbi:MAG: hypothetical protein NC120_11125, partial [Ruminococcus sp.]|nr:hypothetical protein [Ruminococcus sp.]
MIDKYVEDIKKSLENKCYFSALALALALPDICGMAEFPDETSIGKRYMQWYDKYMSRERNDKAGKKSWLNGEIVYNLRNTYLHTGSPNINGNKIKDKTNQINKFVLFLGDDTQNHDSQNTFNICDGKIKYKAMIVDVTNLCNNICNCALEYFNDNIEKFHYDFNAIRQEELPENTDVSIFALLTYMFDSLKNSFIEFLSDDKPKIISDEAIGHDKKENEQKKSKSDEKKREHNIRCFFGKYFKEKKYKDQKEDIIK